MYEVSNYGNFRNIKNNHILSLCQSEKGYMMGSFRCTDEKSHTLKIHRIVAWMFVPGYDELHNEVNHKDGNKRNNHASNLEWSTRSENIKHGIKTGLFPKLTGTRNGMGVLTDDDVHEISHLLVKFNGNCRLVHIELIKLGKSYITFHMLYDIKYKKTGVHISDLYFAKDQFVINKRIMGDDIHIVCKAICMFDGDRDAIMKYLKSFEINISKITLENIMAKRTYKTISDMYFDKHQYGS